MEVNVKGCNESLIGISGEEIVEDIRAENYSEQIDSRHETSDSGNSDSVNPKEKYIHTYAS